MPLPPDFERTLWSTADTLWANTGLKPSEYAEPVLSLVFLRFADVRFAQRTAEIMKKPPRMGVKPSDYIGVRVPYLPERARYDWLLQVPAGGAVVDGKKRTLGELLDAAMVDIEAANESLRGILYRGYARFPVSTLNDLLKRFSEIPSDVEGDVFGRIYEYFLGEFAKRSLEKGGEFYTPVSVVRLIVDVLQPYKGRVLDPACGSGGMFVQSARFVSEHGKPDSALSVHGIEKAEQTLRLCRLNLAIHGLPGNVVVGNSYYDDPFKQAEGFQFVMANPPFNQSGFDRAQCEKNRKRYPLGVPSTNNANFLWIQLFYTYLAKDGRAGFVMANSASDARGSEDAIRQKLIEEGVVDVMVTLSRNLFYTVTLPVTLWFLDKGKAATKRADTVLFIDAGGVFRQVDRAHRELTAEQVEYLANIVRLYRGEEAENLKGSSALMAASFPKGKYADVAGLCKVATRKEIAAQGWSLNAGRYVGVAAGKVEDFDFKERLEELNEQLEGLNVEARGLEAKIAANVTALLEG